METGTAADTEHMEIVILLTEETVAAIAAIIVPTVTEIIQIAIRVMTGLLNNTRKTEMKPGVRF